MTHVSPTPETDDAAIPEIAQIARKLIPPILQPVKYKKSRRLLTLHVIPTQTDYQSMGKRWHKHQNMTITKYAHIRTEMWLELQLKSAVLAE